MQTSLSRKTLSLLLVIVLVIGMIPAAVFSAESDEMKVVLSVEGLTLGQGFYIAPTALTLSEINELLAEEGYGPYTEDSLTAGMATLAMFKFYNMEYNITGSWDSDAYVAALKQCDTGELNIPAFITEKGGPSNDDNDGNDDDWLGEFDYSMMAGWMVTVNDFMIDTGCAAWNLKEGVVSGKCQDYGNTYVIRWQFTLWGYGTDLGFSSEWSGPAYFDRANKDLLYTAYALSEDDAKKAAALPAMAKLDASQAEVDTALALLEAGDPGSGERQPQDVSAVLNATMAKMATIQPAFGSIGGEWAILGLARGEYYAKDHAYFTGYYDDIVTIVNETASSVSLANGALDANKSTENSRLILALSAIGKDATSVGNWNLIAPYEDFNWIKKQGINGPVFTLIALDTHNYQTADTTIRQQCVDFILSKALAAGGWAFFGSTPDPDMTGMALQALAPYRDQPAVAAAAETAFNWLSSAQNENGGFASWGTVNAESIAQVIVAATAWGINPDTDSRFVKNGKSAVDALLSFYLPDGAAFQHTAGDGGNGMATEQACYALVAYNRFVNGKTSLYNMTDVVFDQPASGEMTAVLGLPAQVESTAGTTFNATVNLTQWDNEAGYKLIDLIVTVPEGLSVTGVTAGSRLSGGELSYNLEADTGKLRIVYFDANAHSNLTISGTQYPAEVLTIGFAVENVTVGSTLPIAISGMSVKKTSDSTDENAMVIVNTDTGTASGNVEVVQGISLSAVTVYTGDDVDLIPSNKKAVAVAVTGTARGGKLQYNDGTHEVTFLYSLAISRNTGVNTYLALVDADIEMSAFVNQSNYSFPDGRADRIEFGDINGDTEVNAQDALAVVDFWLRKGEEPTDLQILTSNVNGDSRINTFDALGIVEAFVNGDPNTGYLIVAKVSTLFTNS